MTYGQLNYHEKLFLILFLGLLLNSLQAAVVIDALVTKSITVGENTIVSLYTFGTTNTAAGTVTTNGTQILIGTNSVSVPVQFLPGAALVYGGTNNPTPIGNDTTSPIIPNSDELQFAQGYLSTAVWQYFLQSSNCTNLEIYWRSAATTGTNILEFGCSPITNGAAYPTTQTTLVILTNSAVSPALTMIRSSAVVSNLSPGFYSFYLKRNASTMAGTANFMGGRLY